jgi:hypothetical protein
MVAIVGTFRQSPIYLFFKQSPIAGAICSTFGTGKGTTAFPRSNAQ